MASGRATPHVEHVVDRPDVEAPQGVELTGTNGGKAIILHHPGPGWWPVLRPSDDSRWQGASGMRHKTFFASIVRFPDRHGPIPPGSFPGKVDKICGGHGQGETPGPIPNPEAKALHGDGTAPERVWESSAPPLSHDTVPPGRAPTGSRGVPLFSPTHARAGGAGRRSPASPADVGPEPIQTNGHRI